MIKKLPHQDTIKEHFSYRADGNLIWKKKLNPRAPEIFNKRLNVERILSKKLMFNNMTTKTNEVEEYKKGLSDICKMSGIGMCPGCGLTPEGLEKLTALEVEYEKKEAYAQGWNEGQQALKEETSLAVEKERERIARAMIEASILDEDDVIEEDFEGVSRVDAFMAGIAHMHNAFRTILSPHSDTLEHNEKDK